MNDAELREKLKDFMKYLGGMEYTYRSALDGMSPNDPLTMNNHECARRIADEYKEMAYLFGEDFKPYMEDEQEVDEPEKVDKYEQVPITSEP